jgi:DNA transformation protein
MDRDFLIDLFADFGPVTIRRMFSGYGISVVSAKETAHGAVD